MSSPWPAPGNFLPSPSKRLITLSFVSTENLYEIEFQFLYKQNKRRNIIDLLIVKCLSIGFDCVLSRWSVDTVSKVEVRQKLDVLRYGLSIDWAFFEVKFTNLLSQFFIFLTNYKWTEKLYETILFENY